MRTIIKSTKTKEYNSPQIERIVLDNDISLILSSPADLPEWSENSDQFNNDPFKTNAG